MAMEAPVRQTQAHVAGARPRSSVRFHLSTGALAVLDVVVAQHLVHRVAQRHVLVDELAALEDLMR